MKILETTICLSKRFMDPIRESGYNGTRNQLRIICGCKSLADANGQCERLGLGNKVFHPAYTSETFNEKELSIAAQGGVFIQYPTKDGTKYLSMDDITESG